MFPHTMFLKLAWEQIELLFDLLGVAVGVLLQVSVNAAFSLNIA